MIGSYQSLVRGCFSNGVSLSECSFGVGWH